MTVHASLHLWIFFDVAERIRLDRLSVPGGGGMRPATEEHPGSGARILYFECGVIGVEYEWPFSLTWEELLRETATRISSHGKEEEARRLVADCLAAQASALDLPYPEHLTEEYCVVRIEGQRAADLLLHHGSDLARLVRGEARELSPEETREVLSAAISYFPDDLLVVGWAAAFLCGGRETAFELLAYANVQLLELRRYDAQLSSLLAAGYGDLRRWRRWSLRSKSARLYGMLIDIRESTERMDNAVKFLSDTYAARVYRLAAARIGADDYRKLVDAKLKVAQDVYHFMVDQFHHTRAFILEAMVVLILIIDLYYLILGKP